MRRNAIPPVLLGLSLVLIILGSLLLPAGLPAAIAQGSGETETLTPTVTETAILTETVTATLTVTETATPTLTPTVTETAPISSTASLTATPTATVTSAPTETATVTPTATEVASPTITPTVMHQQFLPAIMQRWDPGFQPGWHCWSDDNVPDYCRRPLAAAAAVSTADVWAVGAEGAILHWDGSRWRLVDSPVQTDLAGLTAASSNDVWAVGAGGVILHWNGERWRRIASPTGVDLIAVTATSASDAWAIGDQDTILHWNGSLWQSVPCPTDLPLRSLTMQSATNGWIAGGLNDTGVMLHWDGQTWTKASLPDGTYQLNAVAMVSNSDGWAMGGYESHVGGHFHLDFFDRIMLRWNGQAWTIFDKASNCCGPIAIATTAMVSTTDGWAITVNGGLLHWDGSSWTSSTYPDGAYAPDAVVAVSPSDAWAVGKSLVHWDGHGWSLLDGTGITSGGLIAVSAVSASDAWAVGYARSNDGEDDAIVRRWNGRTWSPQPSPGHFALYQVAMLSANEGWAYGTDSNDIKRFMLHWTGTTWTPVDIPYGRDAQAVIEGIAVISPSDAWAIGYHVSNAAPPHWDIDTLILHWDGTAWREVDSPPSGNLLSMSMIAPDDGWAVGFQVVGYQTSDEHVVGLILHWDGHAWTPVPSPANVAWRAIAMLTGSDGWMAGGAYNESSRMLHWNGTNWIEIPCPQGVSVRSIAVISPREAWAGGSGLLRWDGEAWKRAPLSGPMWAMSIVGQDGWALGGREFAGLMRYAGSPDQLP